MPQFEIPDPVEKAVQEYLCPMPKTTEKLRTICKFVLFSNPDDHGGGPPEDERQRRLSERTLTFEKTEHRKN